MSGIYLHIPFCKQACHYCDFHFSTSLAFKEQFTEALCKELFLRNGFFQKIKNNDNKIDTIYFGGGTPSILDDFLIEKIVMSIHENFDTSSIKEFTFEANPDDLNKEKLMFLKDMGVNRLSIGVQSFDDKNLAFLNRAHSAKESHQCLSEALYMGFDLSIDLIYGIHCSSSTSWSEDLAFVSQYGIEHLSAYCLTIEEKTAFGHWLKSNKINNVDENKAIEQYEFLAEFCEKNEFEQYEISNYAQKKKYAIHNTNYWLQKPYLGLGPSAHSFDIDHRYINKNHNAYYIQALNDEVTHYETEFLTILNKRNEYLITSLRTMWGCSLHKLFDEKELDQKELFLSDIQPFIKQNLLLYKNDTLFATKKSRLIIDEIIGEIMF